MRLFLVFFLSIMSLCLSCSVMAALSQEVKADLVVVNKSQYRLSLMRNGKELRYFWIALGRNPIGTKVMRGDKRTPEGRYTLDYKNAYSKYYKSIHISYPNKEDKARAQRMGVNPGGMLMIHGQPNGVFSRGLQHSNWTNGCIALLNHDMDELWRLVDPGTPIDIYP